MNQKKIIIDYFGLLNISMYEQHVKRSNLFRNLINAPETCGIFGVWIYILYIVGLNIYVVGSSWTFSKGV